MSLSAEDWGKITTEIREQAVAQGYTSVERFLLEKICWLLDERESPPKKCLFTPNDAQREFLDNMWYWNEILKARQQGFSALLALLMFIFNLLHKNYRGGIIDRTDVEARKKLARIRFAYDNLQLTPLGAAFKSITPLVAPTNDHTITFANGSQIYAATSLRGGTLNFLWISELGTIAINDPRKADEIMHGSLEAVHPGNIVVSESTHEGGRSGQHYRLVRLSQKTPPPAERSNMQWAFHFFGWWKNQRYAIPLPAGRELKLTKDQADYFSYVENECQIKLTDAQKNWYLQKAAMQPNMARQYPGTPEEALQAISEGAIYADIIGRLRTQGRICDLVMDPQAPLFTSWDLGETDASAICLIQIVGPDVHCLDFHCANGKSPDQLVQATMDFERKWNRQIAVHYLPHDAHQKKAGTTWKLELEKSGLRNIKVVQRIPKIWVGINITRQQLPLFRFHAENCDEKEFPISDHKSWPSLLGGLEGYRKKIDNSTGTERAVPVHDECESSAAAVRTFCEARSRGMLVGPTTMERDSRRRSQQPQRAIMGVSRPGLNRQLAIR